MSNNFDSLFEAMCDKKGLEFHEPEFAMIAGGEEAIACLKTKVTHGDPFARCMAEVYIKWIREQGNEYKSALNYLFGLEPKYKGKAISHPSPSGVAQYLNEHYKSKVADMLAVRLVKSDYLPQWMAISILLHLKEQRQPSSTACLLRYLNEKPADTMRRLTIEVILESNDPDVHGKIEEELLYRQQTGKSISPYVDLLKTWIELELLSEITGPAWEMKKKEYLSHPDKIGKMALFITQPKGKTAYIARILEGWLEHGELYEAVLRELNAVDAESERKTAEGISRIWSLYAKKARDSYQKDILPLCWEAILKHREHTEEWKIITFLAMLGAVPDESSIEPLNDFIKNCNDTELAEYAVKKLGDFPAAMVTSRSEEVKISTQDIVNAIESAVIKQNSGK